MEESQILLTIDKISGGFYVFATAYPTNSQELIEAFGRYLIEMRKKFAQDKNEKQM